VELLSASSENKSLAGLSVKPGHWQYNQYFALIDVACDWKMRPSEFGLCDPADDLTIMMAHKETIAKMNAWDADNPPPPRKKRK